MHNYLSDKLLSFFYIYLFIKDTKFDKFIMLNNEIEIIKF